MDSSIHRAAVAAVLVAAACGVHAQEVTYGTPKVSSFIGTPLQLEMTVAAAPGRTVSIPCVNVVRASTVSGSAAKQAITGGKVAVSRVADGSTGLVQVRSNETVTASPVLVSIETGCAEPKRVDYVVPVAEAPVEPVVAQASAPAPAKGRTAATRVAGTTTTSGTGGSNFDTKIVLDRVRDMPRLQSSISTGTSSVNY